MSQMGVRVKKQRKKEMGIKLVPLGLTVSNLPVYNLQQIVIISGNEYIENCVEKRSVTISSSKAEGIVIDD